MRTTLNLDDDVAADLAAEAKQRGTSMSRVANDLLRAGAGARRAKARLRRYLPPVVDSGRPLLDVSDVAGALAELEGRG